MERHRARMKLFAALSALVTVIGACAGATTPAPTTATPATPATTSSAAISNACGTQAVSLSAWTGFPEVDAVLKQAGVAFKAAHPNVDVTVFATDARGFEQKLATAVPSKTAGDLILYKPSIMSGYIDAGLMASLPNDLQTFAKSRAFDQNLVQYSTYNDKLWSLPVFESGTALYYNKDMLAEAGVNPPSTMDELVADARKLAKYDSAGKLVRSGWSLRLSGQGSGVAEKWWALLLQFGKSLVRQTSPGKYRVEYNGPEGVKTFQMYVDLLQANALTLTIDSDSKAFENGSTAMFVREPYVIADIAKNAPQLVGHYGTISLPKAEIGVPNYSYVPAASANQACAWEFARFLTDQDSQLLFPKIAGWLPVRSDLDFSGFLGANAAYDGFLKKPAGYTLDYYPTFPEFDEIATKLADHLVKGYADYANLAGHPDRIQALLDTWASETTSILKQSGRLAP